MTIPDYPDSRPITLEDKPAFDAAFAAGPPELSAYTFTNIFAWREAYGFRLSQASGHLLVWREHNGGHSILEPIGAEDPSEAIERVMRPTSRCEFVRVHERIARLLAERAGLRVEPDRDNSDYLYLASDLIDLPGRKFDAKRNFINRINATHSYDYVVMTEETALECREFADYWCEQRSCETVEGLVKEQYATNEMLANFTDLGIVGGAIRMDGRIVAFSLGEALNRETLVVHVEKAAMGIDGLYQLINNEFCAHEARGFTYVNREQDLGVPGLRKAKKSYQPVRMVGAYTVTPPATTI